MPNLIIEIVTPPHRLAVPAGVGFVAPTVVDVLLEELRAQASGSPDTRRAVDEDDEWDDTSATIPIPVPHDISRLPPPPLDYPGDTAEIGTPPATEPGADGGTVEIRTPPSLDIDDADTDVTSTDGVEASAPAADSADVDSPASPRRARRNKASPANVHERMRELTAPQQQKVARTGEMPERITLERIYGKQVWEGLLQNPKITPPEVARIARKGTVPTPLLEIIVANRSWLSSGQVRRALLANRRVRQDMAAQILRATPKAELKLVPKQTAYPAATRELARSMLR